MPEPDPTAAISRGTVAAFGRHFWQPPRAHGDVIEDRRVSFLELFYDLVYVVVVSQVAHHLAGHATWTGLGQFAVVFGLVWIAWVNGAIYHDLHGRGDGRTRTFVFAQMSLLAVLAVFTSHATGEDGRAFALVYSGYLLLLAWLWYSVRRQDDPTFRATTTPYIAGVVGSAVVVGASAFLPDRPRLAVWAALVVGWVVGIAVLQRRQPVDPERSASATESMVERFDLFTIIVLGEVVVGVVSGIAAAGRSPMAIVTGILGLFIGFAYWWTYFDSVGGRRVRAGRGHFATWVLGHLPVTMSIAATGAVMVSMIDHADDDHAPPDSALLLSVSVAAGIAVLIVIMTTLTDWVDFAAVYRPTSVALGATALVALLVGWLDPAPWLQILLLWLALSMVWFYAVLKWFSLTHPHP
jgi:low temperature requirement protein LtrA